MPSDDETQATGRTRARLVENAQATVENARSAYRRSVSGGASQETVEAAKADLHAAVMDYWSALRPLSNKDVIANEWENGAVYHHKIPVANDRGQIIDWKQEPALEGWDNVEQFVGRTKTVEREVSGFFGTRTIEETQPQRLPPTVLLEMSYRLDLIASKLGFAPETPEELPTDKI